MTAQRFPQARIWATDVSEQAISIATSNVLQSPFCKRITCYKEDIKESAARITAGSLDLLISNPPYYTAGPIGTGSPERDLARSGKVGFSSLSLFPLAHRLLAPGGRMALITPANQLPQLRIAAARSLLSLYRSCSIAPFPDSDFTVQLTEWGHSSPPGLQTEYTQLAIRTVQGTYTEEFKLLTQAFYLNL